MEYVILGFLMMRDLSQYDLLMAFKKEVSPFYAASLGSIQTMLKKLLRLNLITCTRSTESKRTKNIYSINDEGRKYFTDWMTADVNENKFEVHMSSKVFFLGLLKAEQRKNVVEGFIKHIKDTLDKFNETMLEAKDIEVEEKYKDIIYYQLKTLDLGMSEYRGLLDWCEQLLEEIK